MSITSLFQRVPFLGPRPFRYFWPLLIGYLLLPFSTPATDDSIVFSYALPVLGLCAAAMFMNVAGGGFKVPRAHSATVTFAVLYAACTVGFSFAAEQPVVSLWRAVINLMGLVIFLYIVQLAMRPGAEREAALIRVNRILMLSGIVMAGYFTLNMMLIASEYGMVTVFSERFVGGLIALPWGATNSIASALLMPLCSSVIALRIPSERRLATVAVVIIMTAILLTVSRNSVSCMAFMAIAWALLFRRFYLLLVVLVLAVGSAWMVETFEPGTLDYLYQIRFENTDEIYGLNHRVGVWEESVEHLLTYPFQPVGYYGALDVFTLSPHNIILTTTVEMGWFGLAIFIGLWWCIFTRTIQSALHLPEPQRAHAKGLLVGLIGVAINLQFEDPNYTQQYILYSWLFLGLAVLCTAGIGEARGVARAPAGTASLA